MDSGDPLHPEHALLGALLHDIGKFWQRTGQTLSADRDPFHREDVGPHGAHARWSAAFIAEHVPAAWRGAGSPALFHHNPRDYASRLVAVADRLAASERTDDDEADQTTTVDRPAQLQAVFSRIALDGAPPPGPPRYFPLRPLDFTEETLFPVDRPLDRAQERRAYAGLWDAFVTEARWLPEGDFDAYVESLVHLLWKYTWCVPSAYWKADPDVSLYDHSRLTAAIAACLLADGTSDAELRTLLRGRHADGEAWTRPRALLVGGDLSGIQEFLYTITPSRAARGLKGRSFYLQLLAQVVARWTLRQLDLPITNLVYCGGGRFYLLAPLVAEPRLDALRPRVAEVLLQAHGGDLYLALASVPLSAEDFAPADRATEGGFGRRWEDLGHRLGEAKARRFAELPPETLQRVFAPHGEGGSSETCAVCHREGPLSQRRQDEEERKCDLCASFEELGTRLRQAGYLYEERVEPRAVVGPARGYGDVLAAFGVRVRLLDDDEAYHVAGGEGGALYRLDATDFLAAAPRSAATRARGPVALGFQPLCRVTPLGAEGVAQFGELAEASTGVHRLGVLRMDVDNLGRLFGQGLGQRMSPSRVATLSSLLRLFFEGWVARICREHNERSGGAARTTNDAPAADHLYAIYSGGDDLFLVGSWDRMPTVARTVRRDFGRFTGHNPHLHLSGGLAVVPPKYPLYRAAEEAHEELERAKTHQEPAGDGGPPRAKDAFTFLGVTQRWERWDAAREAMETLEGLVRDEAVPRGLLHLLQELYAQTPGARRRRRGGPWTPDQVEYGRWMWLAAYSLARLRQRVKSEEARQVLGDLEKEFTRPGGPLRLALAARWAELRTRKEEVRP
ncbi:MAG TPA: type III-A CRISPR-associated protein Cas10/Csm1 [Chloroflexota bacterium]